MATFQRTLGELFERVDPASVLDVGCGEAILTHQWATARPATRVVGFDLEDPVLRREWEQRTCANLEYRILRAQEPFPFADGEFALATAIEVLEHVPDPEHTVAEMARCARGGHLLVVGAARAAVARAQHGAGRVPEGSREHPRARQPLVEARLRGAALAPRRGRRGALAVPVDDAARRGVTAPERAWRPRRARSAYGRGARILSVGIATTGVVTFAYFSVASHVLDDAEYKSISLLWSVLFVTVSVIYRPIEQLLSRTIADRRARGLEHDHPLRTPLLIQGGFALAFAAVALALRGPIQDGLFDGSAALYWILVVAVLAYAASYFARGWLAGHQWFGLYGGLVFLEATSRLLFALAVAVGIAEGQTAVALGMAAAPFVSLVVVPLAFSRRAPAPSGARTRATRISAWRAAAASRSRCWRSCSPSRRCSTRPC